MNQQEIKTQWLLYKTEKPVVDSGSKYDDELETQYQWDSTVPNYDKITKGDWIAIWDGKQLLGVSLVEKIITAKEKKKRNKCPLCKSTDIRLRKILSPPYKCGQCKRGFDEPIPEEIDITSYKAQYEPGWKDLSDLEIKRETLKTMWVGKEGNQHSLRKFKPGMLEKLLKDKGLENHLNLIDQAQEAIIGGFIYHYAKQRRGQSAFRKGLLEKYGVKCAISGSAPKKTIHACHLYSYSKLGTHDEGAGLLLRSDLHALFDEGLLNIDPNKEIIVLDKKLEQYPEYWRFNGKSLTIPLTNKEKKWLKIRWDNLKLNKS